VSHPVFEATDEALLSGIAQGDCEAFARFYDRHSAALLGLVSRILCDEAEAEDALQEAFVSIWERAGDYRPTLGKPLSWALTVTRNKAIDRLRQRHRHAKVLSDAASEPTWPAAPPLPFVSPALMAEDTHAVRTALAQLPREQRHALDLAYFHGLTQAEIATQTGAPLGTVKARIRRGLLQLRDALDGQL
jgi:RNA polymerase sigma-70 factor (ECF subfamily)